MFTSTLNLIKQILSADLKAIKKVSAKPEHEWRKEAQIDLIEVMISEVDREIERNHKRSERTKRCMRKSVSRGHLGTF